MIKNYFAFELLGSQDLALLNFDFHVRLGLGCAPTAYQPNLTYLTSEGSGWVVGSYFLVNYV
jgi:hypothetical protein